MVMTFEEAKNKLKEIANRKYHRVAYDLTETSDGNLKPKCEIYIDNEDIYSGKTWEIALEKRELAIKGQKPVLLETIAAQMP